MLAQFADDLGFALQFKQSVWNATLMELQKFEAMSGLRINYQKTLVYKIGSARNSNAKFYASKKIFWSDKPFKVLGIMLTHNKEQLISLNLDPAIQKADAVLRLWKVRNLSLYGKILVLNLYLYHYLCTNWPSYHYCHWNT